MWAWYLFDETGLSALQQARAPVTTLSPEPPPSTTPSGRPTRTSVAQADFTHTTSQKLLLMSINPFSPPSLVVALDSRNV
jgi:hypothetical protein